MQSCDITLIVAILAITFLEAVALIMYHINGVALSGVVATITTIALKRTEMIKYYGRIKYSLRNRDRSVSPPSESVDYQKNKLT